MRTRSLIISATMIAALVLALAVIAVAADNPFVGTWKMNPAKSNGTNYKSYSIKVDSRDNGFGVAQDIVNTLFSMLSKILCEACCGKTCPQC
jgi:hypothetical protein